MLYGYSYYLNMMQIHQVVCYGILKDYSVNEEATNHTM